MCDVWWIVWILFSFSNDGTLQCRLLCTFIKSCLNFRSWFSFYELFRTTYLDQQNYMLCALVCLRGHCDIIEVYLSLYLCPWLVNLYLLIMSSHSIYPLLANVTMMFWNKIDWGNSPILYFYVPLDFCCGPSLVSQPLHTGGSGVMPTCDLFCSSVECSSNRITTQQHQHPLR